LIHTISCLLLYPGQQIVKLKVGSGCDTIVEGHRKDITCEIKFLEKDDTIVWKKDNIQIKKRLYQNNRDHLRHRIKKASKRSHAGTYSCEVLYGIRTDDITMGKLQLV
jgi:hypothetical protein